MENLSLIFKHETGQREGISIVTNPVAFGWILSIADFKADKRLSIPVSENDLTALRDFLNAKFPVTHSA